MSYPIVCSLYVTSRCDNACQFCLVRSPLPGDADPSCVERNITEFSTLGGRFIDFTGGNPLMVSWLPSTLELSDSLKLRSLLTISGPLVRKRLEEWGDEWLRLPHVLNFSIDGDPEYHNANRGRGYFRFIEEGLRAASKIRKGRETRLIFTIIPGESGNLNRDQMATVLQLARQFTTLINVNPLFNSVSLTPQEIQDLKWFAKQADVQASRGKIRFLLRGGNNRLNPTCQAARAVLTISSDNRMILPCYHHSTATIGLEKGLRAALNSETRRTAISWNGRYDFCTGCTIWCYLMPSFLYHWSDRLVVWEHALSGLQDARDFLLRIGGRLHRKYPYPDFVR